MATDKAGEQSAARAMAEQIFFHVLLKGGEGNPFRGIANTWFIELATPKITELLAEASTAEQSPDVDHTVLCMGNDSEYCTCFSGRLSESVSVGESPAPAPKNIELEIARHRCLSVDALHGCRNDSEPAERVAAPPEPDMKKIREEILAQSFCGVAGHFKFQQNGSSCLMCQREQQLTAALQAKVSTLEQALRTYGQHTIECGSHHCWHAEHEPTCCDCGYTAALSGESRQ